MAAAASAKRPAEAEELCPGGGPLLRLRSASNPQPRAPGRVAKCPAGCGGDLPGAGAVVALPCCGHSACLRCFQRPRSCPRCSRLRGSRGRPGSETGPAVEPNPRDQCKRSCPERCRDRLDRRNCDSRKDSSVPMPQSSWCGGVFSDQLSKVKVKTVLSDSENEEPVGKRTRNVLGTFRKCKTPSAFRDASQRSQSCTASVEGGGKRRFLPQTSMVNVAGARHSFAAGILLSSENSPVVSLPISTDRRLAWRGLMISFPPPARPERSVSPESNDSISEELNHFKPIVCSPCTPPGRLADGRLLEPTVVKSTPRNLLRGLQSPTSYQASPAVLLKWRQIELDRQSLKVTSKATLTGSPLCPELQAGAGEEEQPTARTRPSAEGAFTLRTRRRVFGPAGEPDGTQKAVATVCIPARRYYGEGFVAPDAAHCSGSLSGPSNGRTLGTPLAKEPPVAKTQHHPTSRKGKHSQKTKHLENQKQADVKRARALLQPSPGTPFPRVSRDLKDRVLALKRHTPLDSENQPVGKTRAPRYLLRSGVVKQSQKRQSPRKPKRPSRKY
ncbi:hypothetical protein NHX12_008100 [Muraenolepis orangiensis]|uniref:Uncharacterized protein n=1 Tax=Muraenolepis orangiensis TaxID=630683 RepID=A0A9Q0DM90_9TELE|nr:hypothetical protein NHX12_008100 [Muraenolepis orangiensis]